MLRADKAAEIAYHYVKHYAHGYSQVNRHGDGTTEDITLSDGSTVTIPGGDVDCSRLVQNCYAALGVLDPDQLFYTQNQRPLLTAAGFKLVKHAPLKAGDILWRPGHTAIMISPYELVEAVASEHGTIDGTQGNQTGLEIRISEYDPDQWSRIYRLEETEDKTEDNKELTPMMNQIIKLRGTTGHYYFDGQALHSIRTAEELDTLDKAAKISTGQILPRAEWSAEDLATLKAILKR